MMSVRKCSKCQEFKEYKHFNKDGFKNGKRLYKHFCSDCGKKMYASRSPEKKEKVKLVHSKWYFKNWEKNQKVRKKYVENNKEKIKLWHKKNRLKNIEKFKIDRKKSYQKNKVEQSEKNKIWYQKNKEYCSQRAKKYNHKNREKIKEAGKKYREEKGEFCRASTRDWYSRNKERVIKRTTAYSKRRYQNDFSIRMMHVARARINAMLRGKSIGKFTATAKLVGCSREELVKYLERQFEPGMTWDNYGIKGWHVDHILPCASFDFNCPVQQVACCHYSNLQPLWALDNIRKGAKIL
jgi:hypothetical protein